MGRRSASWAGLLDGSSSTTTNIVMAALIGRAKKRSTRPQIFCSSPKKSKKKRSTRPQMFCFSPKLSVKQWHSEKFQKGAIIFTFFFIVVSFGSTTLKLIEKQERLVGGPGACSPGKI